uniref:IP16239p n=1 Tax=Drosophila melanogaster TaxID=7227 RepID=B5RJI7_DROME|nr:IP16239p [Drosophila melanogaster]
MLRSCVCLRTDDDGKRRSSSVEDASSCRSSEIERVGASMQTLGPNGQPQSSAAQTSTRASSLLQLFQRRGWCKHFRKPLRGMSASRAEKTIRAAIFMKIAARMSSDTERRSRTPCSAPTPHTRMPARVTPVAHLSPETALSVVSWGYGCGDVRYPGVYADVAHFHEWIERTAEEV